MYVVGYIIILLSSIRDCAVRMRSVWTVHALLYSCGSPKTKVYRSVRATAAAPISEVFSTATVVIVEVVIVVVVVCQRMFVYLVCYCFDRVMVTWSSTEFEWWSCKLEIFVFCCCEKKKSANANYVDLSSVVIICRKFAYVRGYYLHDHDFYPLHFSYRCV